jgi:metal-responsive CopG/Arc/MetJ family transcriptional regulator
MATVNFSVPDDVKEAFNEAYKGRNKSAVITELMREAVERAERKQGSHDAIARILERRKHAPAVTDEELRAAREEGRS